MKDDWETVASVLLDTLNESQHHPNHVTCCEKSLEIHKSSPTTQPPLLQQHTVVVSTTEPVSIVSNVTDIQTQNLIPLLESASMNLSKKENLSLPLNRSEQTANLNVMYNPALEQASTQSLVNISTATNIPFNESTVTNNQFIYINNIPAQFPAQQDSYSIQQFESQKITPNHFANNDQTSTPNSINLTSGNKMSTNEISDSTMFQTNLE